MDAESFVMGGGNEIYVKMYHDLLKKRIIYLNQEISDDLVDMVTVQILLKNIEEQEIEEDKLEPIWLYLNTDGGDVVAALHLIEIMQKSRIPIYVKVLAKACSAGLLITIGAKYKVCNESTVFLLHDGSYYVSDSGGKARDTMQFINALEDKVKTLILNCTKLNEDEYKTLERKEIYCFGLEARDKYGFIDKVL